jgi:hypothetical protein
MTADQHLLKHLAKSSLVDKRRDERTQVFEYPLDARSPIPEKSRNTTGQTGFAPPIQYFRGHYFRKSSPHKRTPIPRLSELYRRYAEEIVHKIAVK